MELKGIRGQLLLPSHSPQVAEAAEAAYLEDCAWPLGSMSKTTSAIIAASRKAARLSRPWTKDTTTDLACSAPRQHPDLPGAGLPTPGASQM